MDSEEDLGNEIMKSESQEVEINSLRIVHFYGNCLKQIIVNSFIFAKVRRSDKDVESAEEDAQLRSHLLKVIFLFIISPPKCLQEL